MKMNLFLKFNFFRLFEKSICFLLSIFPGYSTLGLLADALEELAEMVLLMLEELDLLFSLL